MGIALIVGGNGQLGVPVALALAGDSHRVRVLHRGTRPLAPELAAAGVVEVLGDRADDAALADAVGEGVDVLVDCVAYGAHHAAQVLAHADRVGSAVVISSAAVYADDGGAYLGSERFPDLPVGVREDAPTAPAAAPRTDADAGWSPGGYARGKVALEQAWLDGDVPVTVLRPGAIHGAGAENPREWFAVKRVLDGRRDVVLAHGGESRFHTSAAVNVAELVRLAAARPGSRVLNAVDPEALTSAQIVRAVYQAMGAQVRVHGVPGAPDGNLGSNPWGVPAPFVLDMGAAAHELGYEPVVGYADALPAYLEWIVATAAAAGDWREAFRVFAMASGDGDMFDYAAEDAWLAARG